MRGEEGGCGRGGKKDSYSVNLKLHQDRLPTFLLPSPGIFPSGISQPGSMLGWMKENPSYTPPPYMWFRTKLTLDLEVRSLSLVYHYHHSHAQEETTFYHTLTIKLQTEVCKAFLSQLPS